MVSHCRQDCVVAKTTPITFRAFMLPPIKTTTNATDTTDNNNQMACVCVFDDAQIDCLDSLSENFFFFKLRDRRLCLYVYMFVCLNVCVCVCMTTTVI